MNVNVHLRNFNIQPSTFCRYPDFFGEIFCSASSMSDFLVTESSQKRPNRENIDIISDLNDDVIHSILSRLPIRHAVRTSILSRTWRRKWTSIPNLVFDDNLLASSSHIYFPGDFVKVVNKILLQHDGPILKFVMATNQLIDSSDTNDWIRHLSGKGVRSFTLEISGGLRHIVHSRLFSFQNLTALKLTNCVIVYVPTEFNGFNSLTKLELLHLVIGNDLFDRLVSNCHMIRDLRLCAVNRLDSVNISAPNLKILIFNNGFADFCLNDSTTEILYMDFPELPEMNASSYGRLTSLIKAPTWFSQIQCLAAGKNFLKLLGRCNLYWRPLAVTFAFNNLWFINFVSLPFQELDTISCLFWMLHSSPKLQKLLITATTDSSVDCEPSTEVIKAGSKFISSLKLIYFKIVGVSGVKSEIEFIKLVLDRSPSLENVVIEPNKDDPFYNGERMLKDLIRCRRASTTAEMLFA